MDNVQIHTTLIKYIFIFHYKIPHITTKHSYVISYNIQIQLNATVTITTSAAFDAVILIVWLVFYYTRERNNKNNPIKNKTLEKINFRIQLKQ